MKTERSYPVKDRNVSCRQLAGLTLLVISGAAAAGCSAGAEPSAEPVDVAGSNLYYVGAAAHWPRDTVNHLGTKGADITVCYKTPGAVAGSADLAARVAFVPKVKAWVENTWGRVADINFFGWGACGSNTNGVLVLNIITGGDNYSSLGYQGAGQSTDSFLSYQDTRQPMVVVHELGHILGFEHEFTRSDWQYVDPGQGPDGLGMPCTTDADCVQPQNYGNVCVSNSIDNIKHCRNAANAGQKVSATADHESVMAASYIDNAVNHNTNGVGDPTHSLSPDDVLGAQTIYGTKPAGSIVGLQGRCAAIAGGGLGQNLLNWPCSGGANMVYGSTDLSSGAHLLKATINGGDQCINVKGGAVVPNNWTALNSATCSTSNAAEAMSLTGMQWRAMGNLCVSANASTAGSRLKTHKCGSVTSSLERWDVQGSSLRLSGTNLCLSTPAGSLPLGTFPTLTACNAASTSTQSFTFTKGEIHKANLCLAVMGGTTQDGLEIGTWDGCNGTLTDEAFSLTGPIHALGQCASIVGSDGSQGLQLSVYPCINATNQEWDYHWK